MTEQRAQAQLDRAGTFRAYPLSWTIEPSEKEDSQSVAIAIQFGIFQQWHPDEKGEGGQWSQEWPQGYFCYGRTFIVGRDGKPKAGAVEALKKAGLWNGDTDELGGPPPQVFVLIDVEPNEYRGQTSFRANWIHPNADVPPKRTGGFAPADESLLASLRARFGGQFKAIAGGKPPAGGPPAPPAKTAPPPAGGPPAATKPAATPPTSATPPRPPVPGAGATGVPPTEGRPAQPPGPPTGQFGDAAEGSGDPGKPPF